jgi:hypothetical protein
LKRLFYDLRKEEKKEEKKKKKKFITKIFLTSYSPYETVSPTQPAHKHTQSFSRLGQSWVSDKPTRGIFEIESSATAAESRFHARGGLEKRKICGYP